MRAAMTTMSTSASDVSWTVTEELSALVDSVQFGLHHLLQVVDVDLVERQRGSDEGIEEPPAEDERQRRGGGDGGTALLVVRLRAAGERQQAIELHVPAVGIGRRRALAGEEHPRDQAEIRAGVGSRAEDVVERIVVVGLPV